MNKMVNNIVLTKMNEPLNMLHKNSLSEFLGLEYSKKGERYLSAVCKIICS